MAAAVIRRLIDGLLALRNDFGDVDRSQGIEGHFPSPFIGKATCSSAFISRDQSLAAFVYHFLPNFSRELITPNAMQLFPETTLTTTLGGHPWSLHPGRIVAHVLSVPTFQFGDPVVLGVRVKSGDFSFHRPVAGS
jgi:hypothetical protein